MNQVFKLSNLFIHPLPPKVVLCRRLALPYNACLCDHRWGIKYLMEHLLYYQGKLKDDSRASLLFKSRPTCLELKVKRPVLELLTWFNNNSIQGFTKFQCVINSFVYTEALWEVLLSPVCPPVSGAVQYVSGIGLYCPRGSQIVVVAHRLHFVPSNSKFLRNIGAQILLLLDLTIIAINPSCLAGASCKQLQLSWCQNLSACRIFISKVWGRTLVSIVDVI